MSNMNRNRVKVDIPMLSKDELVSHWNQKAEQMGCIQLLRADGNPLIGAFFNHSNQKSNTKRNTNLCKLDCCAEKRPPLNALCGIIDGPSRFPDRGEPEFTGWVSVEPRSVRRLKTRARFQKDNEKTYERPSVLYAMTD